MLPIKRIDGTIRIAGAHRLSEEGSLELVNYLENSSTIISKKAVRFAWHAGRKTVKRENLKNALSEFSSGSFGRHRFGK